MRKSLVFLILSSVTVVSFAADAQSLYRKCKGCHGKDGKHAPYEKQTGILAGRSEAELVAVITAIRNGQYEQNRVNDVMKKAVKKLNDEDISLLSKYIATFKK